MKIVILILAIVVLLWLLFGRSRRGLPRHKGRGAGGDNAPEGMVACAHCGVHLPISEALRAGEQAYCSDAHRVAGPRPT
jgi:uncharacterized protein